ncbi:putative centrosomal protein [Apostichopus japonicus]|uniref:Putative centrosomal protein n=1 Tax=Stichopus japonicus TaxID=307972 RepID=A0A2G8L1X5_STIJA|nr:putative centrosomal protein [Apostichopus japonicus]
MDVHNKIQEVLAESFQGELPREGDVETIGEQEILEALRKKGIVDDIMQQLQISGTSESHEERLPWQQTLSTKPATHHVDRESTFQTVPLNKASVDPTRRYLYFQLTGGKAFLEHLQEGEPLPGRQCSTFTIHIHFRGQRFKTKPVPCACDPDFKEGFLLELHDQKGGDASRMADATTLLAMSDPIHLVLIKTEPSGDTTLLSSNHLDWRTVLCCDFARQSIPVELMGIGEENKVPVGIIEVKLEVLPIPQQILSNEVIATQVNLERSRVSERERLFLVYAKQWWKEYLQIRETHQNRLVKIFAQDENAANRFVCLYVKPLRAGRLLDTPRQAARFISVIGFERSSTVGGGQPKEQWNSSHAFLCKNRGDCEDHAILLCNLFLGFGLNAFVCVGTKVKGAAHTWVVTISPDGLVTFWESLSGHRYIHQPVNPDDPPSVQLPRPQYPFRTIGCIFNHRTFYANCQPSDNVDVCCFDLHDESLWKSMSPDAIQSVCGTSSQSLWPHPVPLISNLLDSSLASNDLELQLRALVVDQRKDMGLTTVWDDELSYLLNQALAAYELERSTGVTAGNEEFQHAIRKAIPDGHTFKGFPIQFVHRNARRAFSTCFRQVDLKNLS